MQIAIQYLSSTNLVSQTASKEQVNRSQCSHCCSYDVYHLHENALPRRLKLHLDYNVPKYREITIWKTRELLVQTR